MRDRGLAIFLKALFGVGGISILILTWVQPMSVLERTVATTIGLISLLPVLIGILYLRVKPERIRRIFTR